MHIGVYCLRLCSAHNNYITPSELRKFAFISRRIDGSKQSLFVITQMTSRYSAFVETVSTTQKTFPRVLSCANDGPTGSHNEHEQIHAITEISWVDECTWMETRSTHHSSHDCFFLVSWKYTCWTWTTRSTHHSSTIAFLGGFMRRICAPRVVTTYFFDESLIFLSDLLHGPTR
jgi:hypothetical protein